MSGMFLSIDFEDFAHDLKRKLGLWGGPETGPLRIGALWRCYEKIAQFLSRHGDAKSTFFCTGVIADQAPDLIARIASDGHEIACHYHYHDEMIGTSVDEVAHQCARAKSALEEAANSEVIGFRAPMFRIEKSDPAQYRELAKLFRYDSSWFGARPEDARDFLIRMGLENFRLFPIHASRVFPHLPALRLGGSYLKLFPAFVGERLISNCKREGMLPHIYLHPYEFSTDGEFLLSWKELAPLGLKATYWSLRQHQWNTIGNTSCEAKISSLVDQLRLRGRLCDNLGDSIMVKNRT